MNIQTIKLTEEEKRIIRKLNHPTYTVEWVEEWVDRNDNVFTNALAALQAMGANGFYTAVRSLIVTPEYEKLKERDRAIPPFRESNG